VTVKAVLFDLFDTLVAESRTPPTRASTLGGALGLEDRPFRVEWQARRPLVVSGRLSFAEALTQISMRLIGSVDTAAVEGICEQRIREKAIVFAAIDDGVAALVSQLRGQGLRLAVISNCFAEDVSAWPDCVLSQEFHCSVFSCSAGVTKPDPEIYRTAMRQLGVDPEAAIFVGDDGDRELFGAARVGLRAFRADWFVDRDANAPSSSGRTRGLANPQDVLRIVTGGPGSHAFPDDELL
jgi:putative hydrolase of the HAD superfamily